MQKRSEELVCFIVPARGPGYVQDGTRFSDPGAVYGVDTDGFLSGEQAVLGVAGRRLRTAVRVEDAVDVEQQQGSGYSHVTTPCSDGGETVAPPPRGEDRCRQTRTTVATLNSRRREAALDQR